MKVLRGTLTFVLGMVIGIILFVLAIGGAVVALGTSITVGQLQSNFTQEGPIAQDSDLYNQTILDAVKNVISDVQGFSSGSVSLQTLYQHYGISILNGISGIDFTTKAFYTTPVKDMLNDLSIVVNSFTLNDMSKLADIDFSSFNLPILDDNLDNNVKGAIENIMGSLNGDLSVRKIKDNFGIDIGVEDNKLIATLQDVSMSSFGAVVNAITLDKLLEVDSDTFIPKGDNLVYQKVDRYEEVSKADLANANYSPALGIETYIAGAIDTDGDGTTDKLVENELRYIKKTVKSEDGTESEKYVVDNSCYGEDFSANENETTFYRHVEYVVATNASASPASLYILAYANRIATFAGSNYTLVSKGFVPLTDITFTTTPKVNANKLNIQAVKYKLEDGTYEESETFYIMDAEITKDSMLRTLDDGETADGKTPYLRIHKGTSAQVLQIVSNMSVVELQNADNLLDQFTIGDVVDTTKPDTAKAIIALKDCKLSEIGVKINDLKIDEFIDIDDDSAPIMKALANRGCTLKDLDTVANKLTIGEVLNIEYDVYEEATDGAYVKCNVHVPYNSYAHGEGVQLYAKQADGTYSKVTAVADGETAYVAVERYRIYNADTDGAATRYNRTTQGATALALQQMARRGYTLEEIGTKLNDMFFDELVRIESGDNVLMKSLSKKDATLDNISEVVDTLKVDEVIEIDETSSRLMQSLKARDCLITDLGNISDQLTLAETTDIAFYEYTESTSGKYVKVVETDKYVFYDGNEYFESERYSKGDDGKYKEDADGKYAKAFYFTLYNPVEHKGLATYTRTTDETELGYKPSSAVLQRMAYSTLGEFSDSFGNLTLGDVMDIDADIYAKDETVKVDTSYFYYDAANRLFMRQGDSIPTTVTDDHKNYKVAVAGTSSSVIKRLAYVPVDDLSSAMEIVMKDMLLSELVDVYEFSTIESIDETFDKDASTIDENDRFIVNPVGVEIDSEGNKKPYTYVYDETGKYIARDYAFVEASDALRTERKSGTVSFKYEQTKVLTDIESGNIYYRGTKDGTTYVYDNNATLCAYVAYKNPSTSTPGETTSDKLYKRVDGTDYTFDTYNNTGDLYVLINGKYVKYESSNLAHAGETIYQKQEGSGTYYVSKSTPGVADDSDYAYKNDVLYAKQYCENIYVKDANGAFVVINGKAEQYDASVHDSSTASYNKVVGYLAQTNEVYNTTSAGGTTTYTNPLPHISERVTVENEKSEAVLRMIARKQVTIENINGVIKEATISDLMDVTEGSLFYDVRDSKLDDLSSDVEKKFSTMTMGQLISYANITDLEDGVKEVISDITLENFFRSLSPSETAGIVINLEKAYGYKA